MGMAIRILFCQMSNAGQYKESKPVRSATPLQSLSCLEWKAVLQSAFA
jgi:hypothetical protein